MAITISGSVTPVAGSAAYGNGSTLQFTAAGTSGQVLQSNGASAPTWATPAASGVTSVDMSVPSFLYVSGNPITSSGTLAVSLSQSPNNGQLLIGNGGGFTYATLTAGANVTITNGVGTISIASSGGSSGITWSANTTMGGSITGITSPTGYSTSGNKVVVVIVGSGLFSYQASITSGSATFSTQSSSSNMAVFAADTGSSMGSTISISFPSFSGYAMAYVYVTSGNTYNMIGTSYTSSSSTSVFVSQPSTTTLNPRIIGVSTSSSLNLATAASTASSGGPTWATGSGYAHPTYNQLSACVWVGTGSWNSGSATANVSSNPSFSTWYVTGIATS
jgi:hypothetical protein